MTRFLGVDPGMVRLGLGCIDRDSEGNVKFVTHGLISNPRTEPVYNTYLNRSIQQVIQGFSAFVNMIQPTIIVAEKVPPGKLGRNSELVIAAITTCKVISCQKNIPWLDLAANTVKKTTTGDGLANKTKIRNVVFELFPQVKERHQILKQEEKAEGAKRLVGLPYDVTDAIAIAYAATILLTEEMVSDEINSSLKEIQSN